MELQEATRKPFPVKVVQVTLQNIEEVAAWCGGTIEQRPTKMMGTTTDLPVILISGQGESRNKVFEAALGCWIVELNQSFRSYKPLQFDATFDILPQKAVHIEETLQSAAIAGIYDVVDANENSQDGSVNTIEVS